MNKAKTLKRRLGNPKPFLSVAWDTDDIPFQVSVYPSLKWKDINWKRVEKNVFKLQKLIYRASSRGKIPKIPESQVLLSKSYYARLQAIRQVIQDNQGKKTVGIDGFKNLPPMQQFNLEVTTLLKRQRNKCASCGLTFRPIDLMEVDYITPKSKGGDNTYKNKQLLHRHCHETKTVLDNKIYPSAKVTGLT